MSKRLKSVNNDEANTESTISDEINSSDLDSILQSPLMPSNDSYHTGVCGSILYPLAINSPTEIFHYLRHAKLDAIRRSLDIYHKDIVQMTNEFGQTVLHILTIHAYPYPWVRLLLMRECDPCCQDNDGYTAVHYAVERDDVEMLKALTTRFHSEIQLFAEEKIAAIHESCVQSLSVRNKQGLTAFMLACQHESLRCLNYLLELKVNQVDFKDNFGDTPLHYAVARRNEILVNKLIDQCHANVNNGEKTRPSVLDVVQFNREQQEGFDRTKDDAIEQTLLAHHAVNRFQIRRIVNKRKRSLDNAESVISNLACLSVHSMTNSKRETAKNYARIALSFENKGDINNAHEFYKRAMNTVPNDILDWADYALHVAMTHRIRGENQSALDLLRQAIIIRKRLENNTEQIDSIQRMIDSIQIV